jgi:hypothetical protein
MEINFVKNEDGISVDMFINKVCADYDIPYVPERLVDHRHVALKVYCSTNRIDWKSLDLDEDVTTNLKYLENPIYVKRAIQRKEKTKSFSF